jgi:ElaB/YqjD/DUF883 family membrane-anchored ribosome-binding protein
MIEREMESTRESLVEKVAALENQVVGTVKSATSAVQETVESVKEAVTGTASSVREAVSGTVETVRETVSEAFDIRGHIRNHPWLSVGCATMAGIALGAIFRERMSPAHWPVRGRQPFRAARGGLGNGHGRTAPIAATMSSTSEGMPATPTGAKEGGNWFGQLLNPLFEKVGTEIGKLSEEAMSQLTHTLHEQIHEQLPKLIEAAVAAVSPLAHFGERSHEEPEGGTRSAHERAGTFGRG